MADTIYGVSMGEDSTSTHLSLRMNDIPEKVSSELQEQCGCGEAHTWGGLPPGKQSISKWLITPRISFGRSMTPSPLTSNRALSHGSYGSPVSFNWNAWTVQTRQTYDSANSHQQ